MNDVEQALSALEALGLNRLEAEVYITLLHHGAQSGYRIAQILSRPDANVYKALASLADRKLTLEQRGTKKLYRAVPFAEVAESLRSDLEMRTRKASACVARVGEATADDWALYQLSSYEQTALKANALFDSATTSILIDIPASLLEDFRSSLERAAKRGVIVMIKSYTQASVAGSTMAFSGATARTHDTWLVDWMNVVVDAASTIIAYFTRDAEHSILQAIWTESPYLSWTLHSTLYTEISMTCLEAAAERDPLQPIGEALAALAPFPLSAGHASVTKGFRKGA